MTFEGLVASVVWSGVSVYAIWRADLFAARWLAAKETVVHANNCTDATVQANPTTLEIPDDLIAYAMLESESWAQDDVKAHIKEKYGELNDWQKVRRALGIGELP